MIGVRSTGHRETVKRTVEKRERERDREGGVRRAQRTDGGGS